MATNTFRRSQSTSRETQTSINGGDTLRRKSKLGGFEKVKQLFGGGGSNDHEHHSNGNTLKKDAQRRANSQTISTSSGSQHTMSKDKAKDKDKIKEKEKDKDKDKFVLKDGGEPLMRSRYREHHGSALAAEPAAKVSLISLLKFERKMWRIAKN